MSRTNTYSILWINHFAVTPREGGGTRHFELARELGMRGVGVTVAASDFLFYTREYTRRRAASDKQPLVETTEGVRFCWLWSSPYQQNDWRRAMNWLSFGRSVLRMPLKADGPDVVIGSSPHLFAAAAGALLARRFGVPFVLEVRDLWPESMVAVNGRKGLAYHAFAMIANWLYRRAERIVVLARGTGEYLVNRGIDAGKIVYVPNGVDTTAFGEVRRPQRTGLTVAYAGAHGPANGLDVVLDAAELLRERPDIRIVLVGDGPAKSALQEDAARRGLANVTFRDPVPKSSMPALLAEVDAGLMTLKDTPLFAFGVSPNKLFDYFGASLPVICNVPGEVAAMVQESRAGEQAANGSAEALAEALIRMADREPAERAAMGESGRKWVEREHSRPLLAARLDTAIRALLRV